MRYRVLCWWNCCVFKKSVGVEKKKKMELSSSSWKKVTPLASRHKRRRPPPIPTQRSSENLFFDSRRRRNRAHLEEETHEWWWWRKLDKNLYSSWKFLLFLPYRVEHIASSTSHRAHRIARANQSFEWLLLAARKNIYYPSRVSTPFFNNHLVTTSNVIQNSHCRRRSI